MDFLAENPDKDIGTRLAYARPTEPLAQNAIKYIFAGENVAERISTYKRRIADAKRKIAQYGSGIIEDGKTYVVHCHASTVTNAIINAHKNIHVFATETRPRFQGRITAGELADAGIDVTLIVDSAAASVMQNADAVFVGADLLSDNGFLNKIGTYAIALAAKAHSVPVYCFSTILKYADKPVIETRDAKEIWPEAPERVKIENPAFDFTPYTLGVTIVTESGLIKDPWQIPTKII